jgi:predicted nicotinamide N-methyase
MASNIPKILQSDYSQLKENNIDLEPKYGQIIIEELPENKIIIIKKNKIEIIEKNKYLRVNENFDIEVKGDIIINKNKGNLEGMLSEIKFKNYLLTILGNFGSPIFSDIMAQDLTYNNINIGDES